MSRHHAIHTHVHTYSAFVDVRSGVGAHDDGDRTIDAYSDIGVDVTDVDVCSDARVDSASGADTASFGAGVDADSDTGVGAGVVF